MALEFAIRRVPIPRHTGAYQSIERFRFGQPVRTAHVALNGFDLDFTDQDHRIGRLAIDARLLRNRDRDVEVQVTAIFRDQLNNDSYEGFVDVLVIADLV